MGRGRLTVRIITTQTVIYLSGPAQREIANRSFVDTTGKIGSDEIGKGLSNKSYTFIVWWGDNHGFFKKF